MDQSQLGYTIGSLADHPVNQGQLGYMIGALADHPSEQELAGLYMPWMTTPTYHSQLGNTIGTLTDHSNEPESDGIYKRSPGWPPQQTRVRWGIQKESWLQGCSKKKQLKKATQIFVKKVTFFRLFWLSLFFFLLFWMFWVYLVYTFFLLIFSIHKTGFSRYKNYIHSLDRGRY